MFLSLIGVCNLFFFWPFIFILYYSGLETLNYANIQIFAHFYKNHIVFNLSATTLLAFGKVYFFHKLKIRYFLFHFIILSSVRVYFTLWLIVHSGYIFANRLHFMHSNFAEWVFYYLFKNRIEKHHIFDF